MSLIQIVAALGLILYFVGLVNRAGLRTDPDQSVGRKVRAYALIAGGAMLAGVAITCYYLS